MTPVDPEPVMRELLNVNEAAKRANRSPATIRQWVRRGYLTAAGKVGRKSYFRLRDVLNAERDTRRRNPNLDSEVPTRHSS